MDRATLIHNVEVFHALKNGDAAQREFHRSVIKNGKKFLALVQTSSILFIPGHYSVVPSRQLTQLHQKQTIPVSEVERILGNSCGKAFTQGEPLYDEIDAAYVEYCATSCDTPSKHHQARTYWLIRPAN